jgi:hypothetical protein
MSFEKGQELYTLSNLHPDLNKKLLYTMNYQLPNLIPVCSKISVVKKSGKSFVFTWKNAEYTMKYDKHTKKSGVPFDTVLGDFFGKACNKSKIDSLSEIDKKGIKRGIPYKGMSRQGILYAMGRPPYHVNPDLEGYTFMYWLNRFKRKAIDFDDNGIVEDVRL